MKRWAFISALIAIGLILFSGCEKDSTSMTEGDINDEGYLASKANMDSSMTEINDDLIEAVDSLFGGSALAKISTPDYDTLEGWHVHTRIHDGQNFYRTVVDSFRLTDNEGNYQPRHDNLTDEFERRLKRQISFESGTEGGAIWEKERNRNMHWVGLADSLTILNGDIYRNYDGENEHRAYEHTVEGEFQDVGFETADVEDGRPTRPISGQFAGTFITDKELPNREIHKEGEFTVTFFIDHYHVHLVSGDNYWDWDVYYDD